MRKSTWRSTGIGALFVFVTILFINYTYQTNAKKTTTFKKEEKSRYETNKQEKFIQASPEEKFMTFLPHG
jgi:hypothetical protein